MIVISQFGATQKPIRIDTKQVRAAGRATKPALSAAEGASPERSRRIKLLDLDTDDKVAAAMVIPPDESPKANGEGGTLLQ